MSFTNFESNPGGFINPESIALGFGITPGMSIADFGSGAGYFTVIMAQKTGETGKVFALDVQESPLESVRSKAKAANVENIETIRANLEILGSSKLGDNTQDLVLLANILFQSQMKAEIIKEAMRVAKSGARVIIIDWKKDIKGFGPPAELRTNDEEMKKLAIDQGLSFVSSIDAGQFHYGLVFKKP